MGKLKSKIILVIVLLLVLTTTTVVVWNKYSQNQSKGQTISKDVAIQIATSYLKIPIDTPLKSINLINERSTKNENAWEVILDYRVPNTTLVDRFKVCVNSNTGEVLSWAVAGRVAEE